MAKHSNGGAGGGSPSESGWQSGCQSPCETIIQTKNSATFTGNFNIIGQFDTSTQQGGQFAGQDAGNGRCFNDGGNNAAGGGGDGWWGGKLYFYMYIYMNLY